VSAAKKSLALACALAPASAHAHLNSTGMGPLYDGVVHFLSSPEDLVAALGVALLAGLRGAAHGRRVMIVLPCAWLLGGACGLSVSTIAASSWVSALWFVLVGGLVLTDAKLSLRALTVLVVLLGAYHGFLNGSGLGASVAAAVSLVGLVSAVFVLIALTAAFAVQLQQPWMRIALRVVGSWIAASGLLLFGWSIRGG
jgi:hydrogenase/urease accessory protein HupE